MKSIAVFCGSSRGSEPAFAEAAAETGRCIAEAGLRLVYGGGRVGLMGVVADAALAAGGEVVGVIPAHLVDREVEHRGLTELVVVDSMHARKARMADLADAFVALPGGIGTLEEITEIFTWRQLGLHAKPCALLNVAGFYDPLLTFLQGAVGARLLKAEQLAQLLVVERASNLLDTLRAAPREHVDKWLNRGVAARA